MMKSLYSGVSGLRSHQTKMDVIGNNIANVNTNGYKSQRTTFRDVYYQTIKSPGDASTSRGGTNASQVGFGAQIGSIDTIHTISGYTPTDKATDVYINGEGYLTVKNSKGDTLYTRLGALNFDSKGSLVDVNGSQVCGWNVGKFTVDATTGKITPSASVADYVPINIATFGNYKNITINGDGSISAVNVGTGAIDTIGLIGVATVPNQDALVSEGNSYYSAGKNTGAITYEMPGTKSTGALVAGGLEMSNVDLAKEFSDMIITQRGFQANSKIITVADEMLQELVNLKR